MPRNADAEFAGQPERKGDAEAKQPEQPEQPAGTAAYLFVLLLIYTLATVLSLHRLWVVPRIVPMDGPTERFAEGRALRHVKALTDIGQRLVGQPEVDRAADYIEGYGRKLAWLAQQHRPDLRVQVAREAVSGAVATSFLNDEFVNLYNNLTNVVIAVSPAAHAERKGVLINAHFDSTLGTTGASDDASAVGVALETARTLIANPGIQLAAPVIFLLNGGEEALCPAAHGFMQQSAWARHLGVFLNLESTGPWGPDFVFQHTGRWPMQALATAAPFPRGSVAAQDFFELGLVPADTDYRMFSAVMQGTLPGLDTAFLLGAGMYHTDRDSLANIRPGTVQAMGQNAVALAEELGKQLASRAAASAAEEADTERTVFFDVLGMFMVVYPFSWARVLHTLPLILALSLPFVHSEAFGARTPLQLAAALGLETLAAAASLACTVLAPALLAVLRVTALGNPMAWYGDDAAPYLMLVPAALAGSLLPHTGRRPDPKLASLGSALAFGGLAAGLTAAGLGLSFVAAIWASAGVMTLLDLGSSPRRLHVRATVNAVWPIIVLLPNAIALSLFMLQKASFMGAPGQPHWTPLAADAVAGAVIGLAVLSVSGFLVPWVAAACGKHLRRLVLLLLVGSALAAAQTSLARQPYTALAPKKVYVQHLHEHDPTGSVKRSVFAVGAVDSVPVTGLLGGQDPRLWQAQRSGWEWLTLHPFSDRYIASEVLQAPEPPPGLPLPAVELLSRSSSAGGGDRLLLQLRLPRGGLFGCARLQGPMLGWSLPQLAGASGKQGRAHERFVRFTGVGPEENFRFWVDVAPGGSLHVRLAAADPAPSAQVAALTADFPIWTAPIGVTSFASAWTF